MKFFCLVVKGNVDRKNRGSKAVVLIVEVIILQPSVVFILNKTNSLGWDEEY